jgi:hypothetical protein
LPNAVKGIVYAYTPLDSSHIVPSTTRDTTTVSKTSLRIAVGLLELRVLRQNPSVRLAPPRANRARNKVT